MDSNDLIRKNKKSHQKVFLNFKYYERENLKKVQKRIDAMKKIPAKHQNYIQTLFQDRMLKLGEAIHENQQFLKAIIENAKNMFGDTVETQDLPNYIPSVNHLNSMLRQVYREWSEEGAEERSQSIGKIVTAFKTYYDSTDFKDLRVAVPGAGLGRLVYELALTGCFCVHNDNDLHMLSVSYSLMNGLFEPASFILYPWATQRLNVRDENTYLRKVTVPDISIDPYVRMVSFAGDFNQIFNSSDVETFDCVATCFFIDTSCNVIATIEKIHSILKPGGTWFNIGPLTYHYADSPIKNSIEPTFEELEHVIFKCLDFELVQPIEHVKCNYFENPYSMTNSFYMCPFFIAKKQ